MQHKIHGHDVLQGTQLSAHMELAMQVVTWHKVHASMLGVVDQYMRAIELACGQLI